MMQAKRSLIRKEYDKTNRRS